jgi:hypothetical protein
VVNLADAESRWLEIKNGLAAGYLSAAGTAGTSNTEKNACGIAQSHIYTIMAAFEINGEKVFLMRNPWGVSYYTSRWNFEDSLWTNSAKQQASAAYNGIDPTKANKEGYFVVPASELINGGCFYDYYIAHIKAGYQDSWYDADNMDENVHSYFIPVPAKDGDLYFSVESYPVNSVPYGCTTGQYSYTDQSGNTQFATAHYPLLYFALYKNSINTPIEYRYYLEQY